MFFLYSFTILFTLFAQQPFNPELPDGRVSARLIWHPKSKALLLFDGYQIHPAGDENDVGKWSEAVKKFERAQ